jgi:hypothetical protein
MPDSPTSTALDAAAPEEERYDAQAALTKSALTLQDQLFGAPEVRDVIDQIRQMHHEADLAKAEHGNLIIGPWQKKQQTQKRGPQSVFLDEFQIIQQGGVGGYWERPGVLSFDSMRQMVQQTPILNAIVMTRIRQVMRFCRPQIDGSGPGFMIKHVDPNADMGDKQMESIQLLQKFLLNNGWEFDPRKRKQLKRDNFRNFMAKLTRDTLVMDACPIETEFKRDKGLGIDGIYALDGSTIRLCTEEGYEGDDEIFALQVVNGNVRTAYTYDQLIYEVRNPRTDVTACGYGYSETEMLIRVVTYLLNTLNYNASFFDKNSIPRGILNLYGNYSKEDISAFKRYWNAMVRGAQNHHNLPVMVSKDAESKADFTNIDAMLDEMAFSKWLTFLTSIACAIYGTAPEEISMESFATEKSSLSGSDTEEKIASSNDKGLIPLLSFYEDTFSDYVVQVFSEDFMFRFTGLDDQDEKQAFEARKIAATWDEMRSQVGLEPREDELGDMPVNSALIPAWQAVTGVGQPQEDFGDPDEFGGGEGDKGEGDDAVAADADEGGDDGFGAPPAGGGDADEGDDMTKSFGLPIFRIE